MIEMPSTALIPHLLVAIAHHWCSHCQVEIQRPWVDHFPQYQQESSRAQLPGLGSGLMKISLQTRVPQQTMIPESCCQGWQCPQTEKKLAKQKVIKSTSGSPHTVECVLLGWKQKSFGVGLGLTSSFSYMQACPLHQSQFNFVYQIYNTK